MNEELTQAREFIGLLEEAGLSDERIDYYVDKLAGGTFDLSELELELTGRVRELGELIGEGAAIADEISADAQAEDTATSSDMEVLADDCKAEMEATAAGAQQEADMMETSVVRRAEGEARGHEAGTILKIRQFLAKKSK